MGITLVAARLGAILGNVIFGYFVETNCAIPVLAVAILLVSGGLASIFLPNTTKTPLAWLSVTWITLTNGVAFTKYLWLNLVTLKLHCEQWQWIR